MRIAQMYLNFEKKHKNVFVKNKNCSSTICANARGLGRTTQYHSSKKPALSLNILLRKAFSEHELICQIV